MTWQLAQGTVDFRNEGRRHRNGTEQVAQVRREVSQGSADRPASSPLSPPWPPAECPSQCPNCLIDLDPDGYCDGCSYLATVKRPA